MEKDEKDAQAIDAMRMLSRYCKSKELCFDCVFNIRSDYSLWGSTCLFFCEETPELAEERWEERKKYDS